MAFTMPSVADCEVILSPRSRALRAQLDTMIRPYRALLASAAAPSYVKMSVEDVLSALDQWSNDEKELTK